MGWSRVTALLLDSSARRRGPVVFTDVIIGYRRAFVFRSLKRPPPAMLTWKAPPCWSSDGPRRGNYRKVLLRLEHVVEEIRQRVHRHQGNDLHDVRFRVASIADC